MQLTELIIRNLRAVCASALMITTAYAKLRAKLAEDLAATGHNWLRMQETFDAASNGSAAPV